MRSYALPIVGVLLAIVVTATMDATGLTMFSALPLLPLAGLLWLRERHSRASMGLTWGRVEHHGLALLHPACVLGVVAAAALAVGAVHPVDDWSSARLNLVLGIPSAVLMGLLTEEAFFRGWLWASLRRAGATPTQVLAWTTVAFALWHVSPVVLETSYRPTSAQVPVYLANVVLLGLIWGLLRQISGSVVVAAVCHGVWNGLTYPLFGFGTSGGALGIENTAVFGPETGGLGLGANVVFLTGLWWWWRRGAGQAGLAAKRVSPEVASPAIPKTKTSK